MNSLWPSKAPSEDLEPGSNSADDVTDMGVADIGPEHPDPAPTAPNPPRPPLQRDQSQPPPPAPMPPPPPPPTQQQPQATDSLSLMQLRRFVAEFKQPDLIAYDFVYADTGPHEEEIDEWFVYQFWQWVRLNAAQRAFEWHWQHEYQAQTTWDEASSDIRARFLEEALDGVKSNDPGQRSASIGRILYLVLGRWGDSASAVGAVGNPRSAASPSQLAAMKTGVEFLASADGLKIIYDALRNVFDFFWYVQSTLRLCLFRGSPKVRSADTQQSQPGPVQEAQDELMNLLTILYICVQECINDPSNMRSTYEKLCTNSPHHIRAIY
jgi:hypothetical protein